jgi:hypothetical protein
MTVATSTLTARRSNHQLDLIHRGVGGKVREMVVNEI